MNVGPNLNDEPVTAHVKWVRQIISGVSADTAAISRQQTDRVLKFITQGNAPTVSNQPGTACHSRQLRDVCVTSAIPPIATKILRYNN